MKLLLTSAGFTNQTIIDALQGLLSKPISESKMVYVPTAADVEPDDKGWLVDELNVVFSLGFAEFDMLNIAAVPIEMTKSRLADADVLYIGGGNTFHLKRAMISSGFDVLLPELLNSLVYVGASAGAVVVQPSLVLDTSARKYANSIPEVIDLGGLNFVGFNIRPHYKSPFYPHVTKEWVLSKLSEIEQPVYLLDDQSAVVVDGDSVSVVSEGEWELL